MENEVVVLMIAEVRWQMKLLDLRRRYSELSEMKTSVITSDLVLKSNE